MMENSKKKNKSIISWPDKYINSYFSCEWQSDLIKGCTSFDYLYIFALFCTPRFYNLNFLTAAIHLCVQKERNTKTD